MKQCKVCKQIKPLSEFNFSRPNVYRSNCKACQSKKDKEYNLKNKERKRKKHREWRLKNKELIKLKRKQYYQKNKQTLINKTIQWRKNNPEKVSQYRRQYEQYRMDRDIEFKLRKILRNRLNNAIKNNFKSGSAIKNLGCTITELKKHLESQFQEGMTWDNHGDWHIDHIKPLAKFNLSKLKELKKACHYTNLQPLWAKDNLKKGAN